MYNDAETRPQARLGDFNPRAGILLSARVERLWRGVRGLCACFAPYGAIYILTFTAYDTHKGGQAMEIVYKNLGSIIPYENNPRINDPAVDAVAASIREFGFKVPVVIDRMGVIVAGHTRVKAAEKLGMTQVPCVIADDLTDEQVRAFRLADNKTGELAGWDFEKLEAELEALSNVDMSQFGFDRLEKELEDLDIHEDDYDGEPDTDQEPKSKVGDLYALGDHRLICGDATDKTQIEKLLDGEKADLLLADPPYGISVVGGVHTEESEPGTGRSEARDSRRRRTAPLQGGVQAAQQSGRSAATSRSRLGKIGGGRNTLLERAGSPRTPLCLLGYIVRSSETTRRRLREKAILRPST